MSDIECPYCGHEQEINHDDGQGYEEDRVHEQECYECEKSFAFTTSISFYYKAKKAPCMNGESHKYKPTITTPKWHTSMRCEYCDEKRQLTDSERSEFNIPPIPKDYLSL